MTPGRQLRVGVAGLGRAFSLMLPTFVRDSRICLVGAADPRADARARFQQEFGGAAYDSVEALCSDPDIDVVYIATPHQHHARHVEIAASHQKHVIVEKPMAICLADCERMINAASRANIRLIVGHSHSFDRPITATSEIIHSGIVGNLRMITAINFTDFLYRPRRSEELVSERGGGVVFNQAAHQVDIVRMIGGGRLRSVRAASGAWDLTRPTEGAYSALLKFENDVFATLVYSGYAHFDSDELTGWIGEMGQKKDPNDYGAARRNLRTAMTALDETAMKNARNYGGPHYVEAAFDSPLHQHFGFLIASCERGDLRPLPSGVMVYDDTCQRLEPLAPPATPRVEVVDELWDALILGKRPVHDGEWAMATTEVCLAMLQSARDNREVDLRYQVGLRRSVGAQ